MRRLIPTLVLLFVSVHSCLVVTRASAQNLPLEACQALADLRITDTNLLSATVAPATGDLPEYCRVLGYVRPAINFEIRLPTSSWNEKFYMAGCGGWCGSVLGNALNRGLERQYAVSTMDSGHWGEDTFDGRWAYHNRQAEIDWAYRAVHETARVTKEVIEAYYGQAPEKSYFRGCSTGGRQAMMEAQRYPDDFDGIISECPHPKTGATALLGAWVSKVNTGPDGENLIAPADIPLIAEAVYDACDSLDGLKDGLISDPRTCRFDPATLLCRDGETDDCLTADQVEALGKMYDGPRDSTGRRLYPGLPFGSEPTWGRWLLGATEAASDDFSLRHSLSFLRYMAFLEDPGDSYSIADFDFDRDPARMEPMEQIYSPDDPDLDEFREGGGRLLMWHSWADSAPPPLETVAYYDAVEERMGSREGTQEFFRLFMVPGAAHCGFGEGPGITASGINPLTALERWVEQEQAPESLLTTKKDSTGETLWTRPVCPYPQRAVYKGTGNVNDASSFQCAAP